MACYEFDQNYPKFEIIFFHLKSGEITQLLNSFRILPNLSPLKEESDVVHSVAYLNNNTFFVSTTKGVFLIGFTFFNKEIIKKIKFKTEFRLERDLEMILIIFL